MRRLVLIVLLALVMASSASAIQKSNRGQCRKIGKQLERHAATVQVAASRGNESWARSTLQYMEHLDKRRAKLCPDLYPPSTAEIVAAEMRRLLKVAGKAALTFFTLGTVGV